MHDVVGGNVMWWWFIWNILIRQVSNEIIEWISGAWVMYDEVGGDNVTMIHLELSTRESTSSDENIQMNDE